MQSVAREAWTDERLDDLTHRVDEGFNRTEREFQAMRTEMRTAFTAVRAEIKEEFGAVRSEMREETGSLRGEVGGLRSDISALQRTLIQIAAGGFVTFLAGLFGVILTQL